MSATIEKITAEAHKQKQFKNGCAWINNHYLPIEDAGVPIMDVGFSKSDCTYDVVATWKGKFFKLDEHLDRFEESWKKLRLTPPVNKIEMKSILIECVKRSGLRDSYVEMIVTRGIPVNGERDPRKFSNRFYAYAIPYVWIVKPEDQLTGVHLAIAKRSIRIDPQSVDPKVKNFHWGDMTKALYEAYETEAETTVLPNADGYITEGPGFNIFAFSDGQLWTPESGMLEGITRRTVIEIAASEQVPVKVRNFKRDLLEKASEIFLTSTAGGIMPVSILDGKPVGKGKPGPIYQKIYSEYWAAHEKPEYTEKVNY
jgi:branched-chain amino acid aminotransferase